MKQGNLLFGGKTLRPTLNFLSTNGPEIFVRTSSLILKQIIAWPTRGFIF